MPPPDNQLEALARARFTDPPLTAAEIKLLRAAPKGRVAYCGPSSEWNDPANDPSKADEKWGEDRQVRAELIRWLFIKREARELVDPKGIQIYGAKVSGALDLSYVAVPFPLTLQRCRLAAQTNLQDLEITQLNFDGSWVHSITADSANVKGSVLLRAGFHAAGEVQLLGIQIGGTLDCSGGTFENPPQPGDTASRKALSADRADVKGSVFLTDGFSAKGEVRLLGAEIGGSVDCHGGTFENPPLAGVNGSGVAFTAERADVKSSVFLREGFSAKGEVRLLGAEIGGDFDCSDGIFENPSRPGDTASPNALSADRAVIKGSVHLNMAFSAKGEVRLLSVEIGGILDCGGGTFENRPQPGVAEGADALSADGAVIKGGVFLNEGFSVNGDVRLLGAQIGGSLDCSGASFLGEVKLQAAVIKGALFWSGLVIPPIARLDLTNAVLGALADDRKSWPLYENLVLDGFVYERISLGPKDAPTRLKWLERQLDFSPQPYRQLAKVLRDEGDDAGARQVLFELECRRRAQEDAKPVSKPPTLVAKLSALGGLNWVLKPVLRWYRPVWSWILRKTIGYGYYPAWALRWLLLLAFVGFSLFCVGYSTRSMVPTDKDAYPLFKKCDRLPPHYQRFHASVYSLENSLPLVKLGQAEFWQPDPSPQRFAVRIWRWPASFTIWISLAGFLRWCLWAQILLGWILATFFAAGVTGIVRKA